MFKQATLTTAIAALAFAGAANAGTLTFGSSAPTVDGLDVAHLDALSDNGGESINVDGSTSKGVGQSFLTSGTAGFLTAVTYKTQTSGGVDYSGLAGNQDFLVRIGTVDAGYTAFTEIARDTFSTPMNGLVNGDFVTWTFDSSVALAANTEYAVIVNHIGGNLDRLKLDKNANYADGRVIYGNINNYNTTPDYSPFGENSGRETNFHMDISSVPEPGSLALLGLGGLLIARRRRG